jgi:hypothetical protein
MSRLACPRLRQITDINACVAPRVIVQFQAAKISEHRDEMAAPCGFEELRRQKAPSFASMRMPWA